jgi:hypothetical protein
MIILRRVGFGFVFGSSIFDAVVLQGASYETYFKPCGYLRESK